MDSKQSGQSGGRSASPRKILITAINYAPDLTGIGKYVGEMAEWLASNGVDVRVVTAPPYYPAWAVTPGYRSWAYRREEFAGVRVFRCPIWVPKKPTGLRRVIHLASFAVASFPVLLYQALFWRPDVIFVVEPPLFCAPGVLMAARLAGCPAWLHIQDFEVDAAFDLGLLSSKNLRQAVLGFEGWLLGRFERVTTISESMVKRLGGKGRVVGDECLFPNWVDMSLIHPVETTSGLRAELGVPAGAEVLLYSGAMGQKAGLEILIEAARKLEGESNMVFLLCGDGSARPQLEAMASGLSNVLLRPLQPLERLNELLNLASVHLLPQRADAQDLVMPSKLTAMLASGRPVIATVRPGSEIGSVVGQCGVVVPPGDVDELVRAVKLLIADPGKRNKLGAASRAYALDHWERDAVLGRAFGDFLKVSADDAVGH